MTLYPGRTLAKGWLSVATASAKDGGSPQLDRTILIEAYPDGVRLVATDRYVLLHSWIPNVDDEFAPEPELDEAPYATAVAIDPDGRAKGFMGYVIKLANADSDDDAAGPEVRMNLGVVDEVEDSERPVFAGLEVRYVVLEVPDVERVKLRTYEGVYPDWRRVLAGFECVSTETIALGAEILGRLAKLGKIHGDRHIGWTFGGPNTMARITVVESAPPVDGVAMPVRWDVVANRPMSETEAEEAAAADQADEDASGSSTVPDGAETGSDEAVARYLAGETVDA